MTARNLGPSETQLLSAIQQALAYSGRCIVHRNNTGALPAKGRDGKTYPLRYGLGIGSADLVGLIKPSGRFFALEVKTPVGRLTPEQRAWHKAIRDAGGYVATVRSVDEAMEAVRRANFLTHEPVE